jgi:hypothetical protein
VGTAFIEVLKKLVWLQMDSKLEVFFTPEKFHVKVGAGVLSANLHCF